MIFKSIQHLQSKSPELYQFLREHGLFDYNHLFFVSSETWYDEYRNVASVCFLNSSGSMFGIVFKNDALTLERVDNEQFINECINLATMAVRSNQKDLQPVLDKIICNRSPNGRKTALF